MGRFQKILFLGLPQHSSFYFTELPVGIGYLEEIAEAKGFEVDVFDMNLGYSLRDLKKKIERFHPDLIAAQMFSVGYKRGYSIFKALKETFPRASTLLGGAHPSSFREKTLEDCEALDYAIYGEGEIPFISLCSGAALETIPNLIYRQDGRCTANPRGDYIEDLDSLPFPRYKKFELEKLSGFTMNKVLKISLSSSRGCPYQCTYCASGCVMGKRYRYRSVATILDEIEYWYGRGVRAFSFVDDAFTFQAKRVLEFCDGLESRKLSGISLSCDNGIRADHVTREMLARMKGVGFWRVGVGVEAGSSKVLKLLKKGEKIENIRETIQNLCELKYTVMLYFLVGSPGETMEDLEASFRLALDYPVDDVSFNNIVPYPDTELYDYLKSKGLLLKKPEEYLQSDPRHRNEPLFETPEMPLAERRIALKRAFAVEQEVARRAMRRKVGRLGLAGRVITYCYGFKSVRSVLMSNIVFRKLIIEPIKRKIGLSF